MKTDTTDTTYRSSRTELSPRVVFTLLSDDRRRYTMYGLEKRVGAVAIGDLAEQIALLEGDLSVEHVERILVGLHHNHLPKLREADVIGYDPDRRTIERRPAADQLTPFLDLVIADGFR